MILASVAQGISRLGEKMLSFRVFAIAVFLAGFAYSFVQQAVSQEPSSASVKSDLGQEKSTTPPKTVASDPFSDPPTLRQEPRVKNGNVSTPRRRSDTNAVTETSLRRKFSSTRLEFPAATAARKKIEQALSRQDKFQYPQIALADVAADLSARFGIPVMLSRKALDDAGVGTDTQIELDLSGISLRSALSVMLEQHDLTYRIQDEVLMITTHDEAESQQLTTIHEISALLPNDSERVVYSRSRKASDLIRAITSTIEPDTWSAAGGAGSIEFIDHLSILVVTQTEQLSDRVENFLGILHEVNDAKGPIQASQLQVSPDEMIVKIYAVFHRAIPIVSNQENSKPTTSQKNVSFRAAQFGGGAPDNKALPQSLLQPKALDVDSLAKFIPSIIEPGTWSDGKGAIGVFGEHLVVRHYPRVHQRVGQLLADLDLLKSHPGSAQPPFATSLGASGGGFFDVESQR